MMISAKGRYALRVMVALAEYRTDCFVPLKEIAAKQDISQKYMESIMTLLSKNGLVEGVHGKGGGYRLCRSPEQYRVGEILRITENSLAPVSCLECGAEKCERASDCRTLPMWSELERLINHFFDSVTLADLMKNEATTAAP